MTQPPRNETSVPLVEQLAHRWSPRGFDADYVISEEDLTALGEAARWAPSAANSQPSKFIVARRGTPSFDKINAALMGFNQTWAQRASALIVAVSETERDGKRLRWAEYDLGQAVAHLTVEALARDLHVRQMGGFEVDQIRASFGLAPELVPVSVVAVGKHDDSQAVPDDVRERDTAPRQRHGLDTLALTYDI